MTSDGTDEWDDWVPIGPLQTPPPSKTLDWVAAQVGEAVAEIQPLVGGMSSAVHRLSFANRPPAVLRRYTYTDWIEREPHIPHDEVRNLTALGDLDVGVATPRLIGADPDAAHCDVPALLMTEIPGRPLIDPCHPRQWAEKIAACLARIHQTRPVPDLPRYRRWDSPDRPIPVWTSDPDLWRAGIARASDDLPGHPDAFLHRDYHPNNIHWLGDDICGVVDWLSACTGPIAGDLAHCRWNFAVLFDAELADHFTSHYRQITGYSEDTTPFDISVVMSGPVGPFPTGAWNDLGRTDMTSAVAAARIDAWLAVLMER